MIVKRVTLIKYIQRLL